MLKTPRSLQACSSSPMSRRRGSEERVVLPVPDRPKNRLTSPPGPSLARAVHREGPAPRHREVHRREHALLHLAGVVRAQDHHFAPVEVQLDAGARRDAGHPRIRRLVAGVEDQEVRIAELLELLGRRPDEQVVHEQGVVSPCADHADLDPVRRVPAREAVDDEGCRPGAEELQGVASAIQVPRAVDRDIDRSPPHVVNAGGTRDDPLIFRAPAGLLARKVARAPFARIEAPSCAIASS